MPGESAGMTADMPAPTAGQKRLSLRILATTDLHMHLLPYNYLTGRPCEHTGLARTASLITRRRNETANCLLLDNGDFLQGTPLGDVAARRNGNLRRGIHPAIAAMNALGYDAAALGNHDFDFGLSFLHGTADRARFPFLAANLHVLHGRGFAPYVILKRQFFTSSGQLTELKIGIAGFLPPQTVEWDRDLSADLFCEDILTAARRIVPQMQAEGADVIVALAHSGIGQITPQTGMENAAAALAALDGIDAVIAGHTHQVFPGPGFAASPGIDPLRGTLAGKPAVMAGFGGSHLGLIDLDLAFDASRGWRIASFLSRCEAVDGTLPVATGISRPVMPVHRATLRHLRRRIGHTTTPLTSYFALIGDDPGLRLISFAQRWYVRTRLAGSRWAELPLLSAVAPFRAGGRGGPGYYTDVPTGRLSLRSLADLYSFPNRICAIRLSGAQIREWLERSASLFHPVTPGSRDVMLLDPDFPGYNFDVIDGVTWQIDLSQPARFAPDGRLINPDARRIRNLCWQNRPIDDSTPFVLATNSYRLASCGLFSPLIAENEIVLKDGTLTRDVLRHYIGHLRRIEDRHPPHWSFAPVSGATALFETGPGSLDHLESLNRRVAGRLEYAGATEEGFVHLRMFM